MKINLFGHTLEIKLYKGNGADDDVIEALKAKNRLRAIKILRAKYNLSLKDALIRSDYLIVQNKIQFETWEERIKFLSMSKLDENL